MGWPVEECDRSSSASHGTDWRRAAVVLVATLALNLAVAHARRPLGTIGGFVAPYYELGLHVASHQTVGKDGLPSVFKPPGYAVFVGYLLRTTLGPPPLDPERPPRRILADWQWLVPPYVPAYLAKGVAVVHTAQSVALAAASALLFLWLARFLRRDAAFVGALLFGSSPYAIVIAGIIHYDVVHLTALLAGSLLLHRSLEGDGPPRRGELLMTGAVWGLATLVRPVSLLLPPFVLAACFLRSRRAGRAFGAWSWFVLGMAATIAPYTARNLVLTRTLVPVNAQAWAVLFSASAERAPAQPDHFRYKVVRARQIEIQSRVAGAELRKGWEPYGIRDNLALEEGYRRATLQNLRERPEVYLYNLTQSTLTLLMDMPTIYIDLFCRKQRSPIRWPNWYWPGTPQERLRSRGGRLFLGLTYLLTFSGALGLGVAALRRDAAMVVPVSLALALGTAHAITWMDIMYYYLKLPFLVIFGFYGLERALPGTLSLPFLGRVPLASLGLAAVAGLGLAGTASVLIWSR